MRVRATQDGHYGGYLRYGPVFSDQGETPGEVFEISDEKFLLKDIDGNPVPKLIKKMVAQETWKPIRDNRGNQMLDKSGNPMFEHDRPIMKEELVQDVDEKGNKAWMRGSWFASEWMEQVPESTEITCDYPKFELPIPYRAKKPKNGMQTIGNFPIPAGAMGGNMLEPKILG